MQPSAPGVRAAPANHEPQAALPHSPQRRRRPDLRVIVGFVLLLAGVGGTLALLAQAGQRTPVLVATHAIAAGQIIADGDIIALEVGLSPGVSVLRPADRELVVGHPAAVPLAQGQILSPGVTVSGPPLAQGEVAISVPADPAATLGGLLRPGHQVQVLAAEDGATAVVVADAARVLAVVHAQRAGGTGTVTLAVAQTQAPAVASAAARGVVALLLLPEAAG